MESSDDLPMTLQGLQKLQKELLTQILSSFTKLQTVTSKIEEMEQTGTTSDPKAGSLTNDQQTEDTTANASHQATPAVDISGGHDGDEKLDEYPTFDQAPWPAALIWAFAICWIAPVGTSSPWIL